MRAALIAWVALGLLVALVVGPWPWMPIGMAVGLGAGYSIGWAVYSEVENDVKQNMDGDL